MVYYVLVDLDIQDAERFKRYQAEVRPMIEAAGGRYIVRGGEVDRYEGDFAFNRLVIFEWPSKEAHDAFFSSEAYQPLKSLRLETAITRLAGVQGYDG